MMRMHNRTDFLLVIVRAQHSKNTINNCNEFEKFLSSSLTYTPQYESKVAKKFKRMSQIPIQIWLSKNDNIQIYKNATMLQDLNPNVYVSTCCMFVSGYFHLLGMRKTRKHIPCSEVGLDLWK